MADNPYAPGVQTFKNVEAFYTAHPSLSDGWPDLSTKSYTSAPRGVDLDAQGDWMLIVALPERESHKRDLDEMRGLPVSFNRTTHEVVVLGEAMLVKDAVRRFK